MFHIVIVCTKRTKKNENNFFRFEKEIFKTPRKVIIFVKTANLNKLKLFYGIRKRNSNFKLYAWRINLVRHAQFAGARYTGLGIEQM